MLRICVVGGVKNPVRWAEIMAKCLAKPEVKHHASVHRREYYQAHCETLKAREIKRYMREM